MERVSRESALSLLTLCRLLSCGSTSFLPSGKGWMGREVRNLGHLLTPLPIALQIPGYSLTSHAGTGHQLLHGVRLFLPCQDLSA